MILAAVCRYQNDPAVGPHPEFVIVGAPRNIKERVYHRVAGDRDGVL